MNTPEEDAVTFVFDILNAEVGAGGELTALGVKQIIKDEPGTPHENYIAVLFGGGGEIDTSGLTIVTVIVDIRSQELMMGATTNKLARFTERTQLCRQLLRAGSENTNRPLPIGLMDYPVVPSEPDANKKFFFNATITVPVTVGGGI